MSFRYHFCIRKFIFNLAKFSAIAFQLFLQRFRIDFRFFQNVKKLVSKSYPQNCVYKFISMENRRVECVLNSCSLFTNESIVYDSSSSAEEARRFQQEEESGFEDFIVFDPDSSSDVEDLLQQGGKFVEKSFDFGSIDDRSGLELGTNGFKVEGENMSYKCVKVEF